MHPRLQWISRPPRALQVVLGVGWLGLSGWFWYRVYVIYTDYARARAAGEVGRVPDAQEVAAAIATACGAADSGGKAVPALRKEPVYPLSARRLGIEGSVVLHFAVEPDGRVSDVEIRKSEPEGVFERTAAHAVSHWQYCPRAERTTRTVRLDFKLDQPAEDAP